MSLTDIAFERIRDAIVSGRLDFGEPLSEAQLAEALSMSKAPVRAALIELRDKGLITIVPQAGTYVCSPTVEDIEALSHFRTVIEVECLRCAMAKNPTELLALLAQTVGTMDGAFRREDWNAYKAADTAYHFAFIRAAGNRYLLQSYRMVDGVLEALRVRLTDVGMVFRKPSFEDHVTMLSLLEAGKLREAIQTLESHIMRTKTLLQVLPSTPDKGRRSQYRSIRNYQEIFDSSPAPRPLENETFPGAADPADRRSPRGRRSRLTVT